MREGTTGKYSVIIILLIGSNKKRAGNNTLP